VLYTPPDARLHRRDPPDDLSPEQRVGVKRLTPSAEVTYATWTSDYRWDILPSDSQIAAYRAATDLAQWPGHRLLGHSHRTPRTCRHSVNW
jgi:hypothetical protein